MSRLRILLGAKTHSKALEASEGKEASLEDRVEVVEEALENSKEDSATFLKSSRKCSVAVVKDATAKIKMCKGQGVPISQSTSTSISWRL